MIINLEHALFKTDPDERFCRQFNLPRGTWMGKKGSLWYRYKWLYYDIPELQEYIQLKYKITIHRNTLMRWFNRTEIYLKAQRYISRNAKQIHLVEFGEYVPFIIQELNLGINPETK